MKLLNNRSMNKREIRTRLAHAAIIAGASMADAEKWYEWIMEASTSEDRYGDELEMIDEWEQSERNEKDLFERIGREINAYTRCRINAGNIPSLLKYNAVLTLEEAKSVAKLFMSSDPKQAIIGALKDGHVKGVLPEMSSGGRVRGKYQFEKRSLLEWLQKNYERKVPCEELNSLIDESLKE